MPWLGKAAFDIGHLFFLLPLVTNTAGTCFSGVSIYIVRLGFLYLTNIYKTFPLELYCC